MTVQNLYTKYLNGEITKQKFLYEVRRDQNLTMISPSNSFDDVVKILKNKSIISEKASKESTGEQEVEIVAKTIDMVNPYEYTKGMEYELGVTDVPVTSGDLSEENVAKVQKKVLTNLTKNPRYYTEKMCGKGEVSEEWVEVTKKEMDKIGKGKKNIMREDKDFSSFKPGDKIEFINNNNKKSNKGVVKDVSNDKKTFTFIDNDTNKVFSWGGDPDEDKFTVRKLSEFLRLHKNEIKKTGKGKSKIIREGIHDRDITSAPHTNVKGEMGDYDPKARATNLAKLKDFGPKEGDVSARDIAQALIPLAANKGEIVQYFQSLSKAGDKFDTVDDYVEDFKNYIADKSLEEIERPGFNPDGTPKSNDEMSDDEREEFYNDSNFLDEHGQYADRVTDVNADSSPLNEKKEAIYKKYAEKWGKTIDEVKEMVEASTYAGKDAVDDLKKDPDYGTLSSTAKTDVENKLKKGETVTIG